MSRLLRAALGAVFLLQTSIHARAASERTVFLVLEGPSAAEVALTSGARSASLLAAGAPSPVQRRIAEIQASQAALQPWLDLYGARITGRYARLANAIAVRAPSESLPALASLPGVIRVDAVQLYRPLLETSVPWVGTPRLWNTLASNITGKAKRIGIIDSGIDYHHASLGGSGNADEYDNNDPTLVEIGSFPTSKVVGGYDFAGDDFDSSGENGDPFPVPDFDPLDPRSNGHGSHVASIAAGTGVLKDGTPYSGPYTNGLAMSRFSVGPGVAPEAQLYALKVFGSQGSTSGDLILSALELAVDPNEDGNFDDKLDVVNLSLGGVFEPGATGDVESTGINLLSQSGTVVVVAAGNNGNIHFVTGLPANVDRAITVANSIDDGATFSTIKVTAPPALAGDYTSVEGDFTPKLSQVGPLTAEVVAVQPSDACGTLQNAAALKGKIALIDRGTCFFVDKLRRAQTAGAIGVIMVNNVDGPPIPMGGSGNTADIKIPGVMIRMEDGRVIRGQLANGVSVTLAAFEAVARPELADQLENSSSRGPRLPDGHLKPDLAAPGTSINAAEAGSGVKGRVYTGTSMSSPHVAGAAALLKQAHPAWSPMDIKMAMMNAAVPTRNDTGKPYPESRTGAGRLAVDRSARLTTLARLDSDDGEVALSFGALQLLKPYSATRTVRIFNLANTPQTYRIAASNTLAQGGVTLTPAVPEITVPAQGSAAIQVRFDADPARFDRTPDPTTPVFLGDKARHQFFEASGQLWVHGPAESIHVPWHSIVRALSSKHTTVAKVGLPATDTVTVPMPTRGESAHTQPIVSVLQLGATSPNRNFNDTRASGDFLAVGAASDFAVHGSIADTTVFFGFAAAGIWQTPQRVFQTFDIEIDVNNDNRVDYVIQNSTSGNLLSSTLDDPQDMTDAFLALVEGTAGNATTLVAGSTLNVLAPSVRDMASYHNSVALLGAPATSFGLSEARTAFRYRLALNGETFGETSAWIAFDAAKPLIDPTGRGLLNTPCFDEGLAPMAVVQRSAAIAAGYGDARPLQALLLHQHNATGQQVDLVTFDLTKADTDSDGRADVEELLQFGDLTSNGQGDQDGDGAIDSEELLAGTDPRDATSTFRLLPPDAATGAVRWRSVTGRTYTLLKADTAAGPFTVLKAGIPATPPLNTVTDLQPGVSVRYYRVRLD